MQRIAVIVGPTGAGKSRLAIEVARRCGGEVVSADSQQVYVGMDIGTGKVGAEERGEIAHHLIDVVRPDEEMTAARFAEMADAAIAEIAGRGRPIVVCGGTGLYVRILLLGLFDAPPADPDLRAGLAAEADARGLGVLWERLREIDPEIAGRIEASDQKRIIRALEVHALTGVTMSEHQRQHDFKTLPRRYDAKIVGLAPEREALYRRIDARVDEMIEAGLVGEVERLREAGYAPPLRSQQAIGYAELHAHLDGALDMTRAVELIKRNSRRYARRQLAWYRSDVSVEWAPDPSRVDLDSLERYLVRP